jgi:flagellar biosynthesis protein FlhF
MRIKAYFAPDMRQAIRMIRNEMGPDAVILSHQSRDGGIEITAAIDYEDAAARVAAPQAIPGRAGDVGQLPETHPLPSRLATGRPSALTTDAERATSDTVAADDDQEATTLDALGQEVRALRSLLEHQLSGLAWRELGRRRPVQAGILRRLMALGLSHRVAGELVQGLPQSADLRVAWRRALGLVAQRVLTTEDDILAHGGVVALVGSTGVGKTTTVAKLAARFTLQHGARHVGLVTTDSYRVGAYEQLHTFGRIMDVPVRVANDPNELRKALDAFSDRRLVLIDTAGISQRDIRFSKQVALIGKGSPVVKTYMVLSATAQMLGLEEAIHALQGAKVDACVITKVDEATSLGSVLSMVIQHRIPVAYITNGQRVPEDICRARSDRLLTQTVTLAAQSGRACPTESLELAFGSVMANAQC